MMELQHVRLGGFRPVYDSLLRQEETLESIVPDALPDMARIVEATGVALLRQKETVDGSVRVTGTARISVFYLPDGDTSPHCLTLNIPFLCNGDHPSIREGCRTSVSTRIISADAQMLNPRKVLARVEVAVGTTVYAEETGAVCSSIEAGENHPLQTLMECHKDYITTDICDKAFSFSDVLRMPTAKPAQKLLSANATLSCVEAKVIGKKVVVKGEANLTGRYLCESGIASARFDLPFSQIMEIHTGGEECDVWTDAALTSISCELRSDSELEVNFEILLQAAIRQEREVSLLADLYSTSETLDVKHDKVELCTRLEQGTHRQSVRQFCQTSIPAKAVIDCRLTLGEITQVPSGEGNAMVTVKAYTDILYLSEDEELCSASYTIPATIELPVPIGCHCTSRCASMGEVSAVPVTDGLEIRFEVEFSYLITRGQEVSFVAAVRPGQADATVTERPSIVIRMIGEGERLWDIAKCCGSTVDDIIAANALSCDEVVSGTRLLIPKCR